MQTSYLLLRDDVVIGAQIERALGGSSSRLETTSIGLVFAAIPRSTKQTCPGSVVIHGIKSRLPGSNGEQDIRVVFFQAYIERESLVTTDLMEKYPDRFCCGQSEILQNPLGIPLQAAVNSGSHIAFFDRHARM